METLSDIEALALGCRSAQSRAYAAEAIACYRSGAYRASIVATWIALVYDLIDKIRELALSGDSDAKALEAKLDGYLIQIESGNQQGLKSAVEFERSLLTECRDRLKFFDPQQFIDLERLQQDRHRCAHPSFSRPGVPFLASAEQARLHIRNAIVYVLAMPPVQGKAALAELKTIVGSAYFPLAHDKAADALSASHLSRATEPLIRGFVDQLLFGYVTPGDVLYQAPQALVALNALAPSHRAIVEDRLRESLNKIGRLAKDAEFPLVVHIVGGVGIGWAALDKATRDKVVEFVRGAPASEVIPVLRMLLEVSDLKTVATSRLSALSTSELVMAVEKHGVRAEAKEPALMLLSQSRSWDMTNALFRGAIAPLFDLLTSGDVERIIGFESQGADLVGAHGYSAFISQVRAKKLIGRERLNELLAANRATALIEDGSE